MVVSAEEHHTMGLRRNVTVLAQEITTNTGITSPDSWASQPFRQENSTI